jgi:hypothetical protein
MSDHINGGYAWQTRRAAADEQIHNFSFAQAEKHMHREPSQTQTDSH